MRKKLVLQRNLRKGAGRAPSHQRSLVIAAVCLIFLVLIATYFSRDKGKDITKRPVPDRGAVTKELPRQVEQSAPEGLPGQAQPAESVQISETKTPEPAPTPEGVRPPEIQPAPKPAEPDPAAAQRTSSEESTAEGIAPALQKESPDSGFHRNEAAKSTEPAPKDLFPKKKSSSEAPAAAAKKAPVKPKTKVASNAPAAKSAPAPTSTAPSKPGPSAEKGGEYAVQVGTVFTDKPHAEAVRKELAAKGYKAVIRSAAGAGGYFVTTGSIGQSKAYTLLEQMKIQGVSNTKVIKVTPAPEAAKKTVE